MQINKDDIIGGTYNFKENPNDHFWQRGTKINNELVSFDKLTHYEVILFDYSNIPEVVNMLEVTDTLDNGNINKVKNLTSRDIVNYNLIITNQEFIGKLLSLNAKILAYNGIVIQGTNIPLYITEKHQKKLYLINLDINNQIIDYKSFE